MRVLFLDIDGVLNSYRSSFALGGVPHGFEPDQMALFDHVALGLIRDVCKDGVKVVVSSTWRIGRTAQQLADGLGLPVIDVTGDGHRGHRGSQIKEWLDAHPEVVIYGIVDDDDDMLPEQKRHFVKTTFAEGFTFANYLKLCNILGRPVQWRA